MEMDNDMCSIQWINGCQDKKETIVRQAEDNTVLHDKNGTPDEHSRAICSIKYEF